MRSGGSCPPVARSSKVTYTRRQFRQAIPAAGERQAPAVGPTRRGFAPSLDATPASGRATRDGTPSATVTPASAGLVSSATRAAEPRGRARRSPGEGLPPGESRLESNRSGRRCARPRNGPWAGVRDEGGAPARPPGLPAAWGPRARRGGSPPQPFVHPSRHVHVSFLTGHGHLTRGVAATGLAGCTTATPRLAPGTSRDLSEIRQ